jgi:hypothetical protein
MLETLFDWDDANLAHIRRHKIGPEEMAQGMSGGMPSWVRLARGGCWW